ncbi:hypothetical protein FA13DRAFT_1626859 [Coprinellus micaceus]|uniref:UvrD-like helicase C-terminal domain-containing protein n=1 Tax=Coprinellus micaceus TaxID=71717 RepID=A0A4Y7TH47_COPMI|nr:hypothetical protein FA13DRAFT_1626859 [Coprinellus micaceus]
MTAHRAQGQTMTHAIVDIGSSINTQAAYVMVSRATSLDGLLIFQPFSKSIIQRGLPDEVHVEFHRLQVAALRTIVKYGSPEEQQEARSSLATLAGEGHTLAKISTSPSLTLKEITKHTKDFSRGAAHLDKFQKRVESSWSKGDYRVLSSSTKRKAPFSQRPRKRIRRVEPMD